MKGDKNLYSWDNISIDQYYGILEILNSSDEELNKQVSILALVEGVSEDEILGRDINRVSQDFQKLRFLNKFELKKNYKPKEIKIGDLTLEVAQDLQNMTYGAFIDYQAYVKQPLEKSIEKILSLFLIPKGKKYNEGYDVVEIQRILRQDLPFVEAQSLLGFMLTRYTKLYTDSQKYLVKKIQKMENPKKKEEMLQKMRELNQAMKNLTSITGSVYSKGSQI